MAFGSEDISVGVSSDPELQKHLETFTLPKVMLLIIRVWVIHSVPARYPDKSMFCPVNEESG